MWRKLSRLPRLEVDIMCRCSLLKRVHSPDYIIVCVTTMYTVYYYPPPPPPPPPCMTRYIFIALPPGHYRVIDIINLGWGCRALCLIIQITIVRPRFVSFSCRLADLMDQYKEELATLESVDSGSVYTLALKTPPSTRFATLPAGATRYRAPLSPSTTPDRTLTSVSPRGSPLGK